MSPGVILIVVVVYLMVAAISIDILEKSEKKYTGEELFFLAGAWPFGLLYLLWVGIKQLTIRETDQ